MTALPEVAGGPAPAPLLSVRDLSVRYGDALAVRGVSFDVARGETVALVGESGSGKTTIGRAILRLVPAAGGRVLFEGEDLLAASGARLRALRRRLQVVFQDPTGSLDPRMRVGEIVTEGLSIHGLAPRREMPARASALLGLVGLDPTLATRFAHELSGGQRQRVGIARAIALDPVLIVLDECVSALDVSVQAQVLNLLKDLQDARGLAYLFIAHDMAVVRHMAARVLVLSRGVVVEDGPTADVLARPRHEYTARLVGEG